jgi:hypothetical protein
MPYHVYTRSGGGAVVIIVETAKDALAKVAEFLENGLLETLSTMRPFFSCRKRGRWLIDAVKFGRNVLPAGGC